MPYADPEQRRAYGRAWMKRNPERARAAMRRWRARHPDAHAAETRARYARDPKRFQERTDASPNRPAVRRAMHERRRARLLGAGPHFTAPDWFALVEATVHRSASDSTPGPFHADHPLHQSRRAPHQTPD